MSTREFWKLVLTSNFSTIIARLTVDFDNLHSCLTVNFDLLTLTSTHELWNVILAVKIIAISLYVHTMYTEEHLTVPDKGQSYLIAPNVNI